MKKYCKRFGLWTLSFLLLLSLMSIGTVPVTADPGDEQPVTISYKAEELNESMSLKFHQLTGDEQAAFVFTPVDESDQPITGAEPYTISFTETLDTFDEETGITKLSESMEPGRYSVTQTVTPEDFLPIESGCIIEISAEKNQVELQNVRPYLDLYDHPDNVNSYIIEAEFFLLPANHDLSMNQIGFAFPTGSLKGSTEEFMTISRSISAINDNYIPQPPTSLPFSFDIKPEMTDAEDGSLYISLSTTLIYKPDIANPPASSTFTLEFLDAQNNTLAIVSSTHNFSTEPQATGSLFVEKTINNRPLQGSESATFELYYGTPSYIWNEDYTEYFSYANANEANFMGTYTITANDLEPEDGSWPGATDGVRRTMIKISNLIPGNYYVVETTPGTETSFLNITVDGDTCLGREMARNLDPNVNPITFQFIKEKTPSGDIPHPYLEGDWYWHEIFLAPAIQPKRPSSVLSLDTEPLQMPQLTKEFRRSTLELTEEDPLFTGDGTTELDLRAEKDTPNKEVDMRIQFNAPQSTEGESTTIEEFMYQQADWRTLTLTDQIPEAMTLDPDSLKLVITAKPGTTGLDSPLVIGRSEGSLAQLLLNESDLPEGYDVQYDLNYDQDQRIIKLEINYVVTGNPDPYPPYPERNKVNRILDGLNFKIIGTCKLYDPEGGSRELNNDVVVTNTVNMALLVEADRDALWEPPPLVDQWRAGPPPDLISFAQGYSSASASVITAPPTPEPTEPTEPTPTEPWEPTPSEPTEPTPPHCTEPVPPRTPWTPPVYYKSPEPVPTGAPVTVKAKPVTVNAVPIVNTLPKTGTAPVHTTFALSAVLCAFGIYLLTRRRG